LGRESQQFCRRRFFRDAIFSWASHYLSNPPILPAALPRCPGALHFASKSEIAETPMTRTSRLICHATAMSFTALLTAVSAHAEDPPTLQWVRQSGRQGYDAYTGVAIDQLGNVFVAGDQWTTTSTGGIGHIDILQKYDYSGTTSWTREVGTSALSDRIWDLWPDHQGNVYITGYTTGNIGGPNAGSGTVDGYLRKYDVLGNVVWSRQIGSLANDELWRVAGTAGGDLYIAGFTQGDLARPIAGDYDAILARYDAEGNQGWIKQFGGMSGDSIRALTADPSGNIIVAGSGLDGVFAKYNGEGELIYVKPYGDPKVGGVHDVTTDEAGNIYLLEQVDLPPSSAEFFVSKYDNDGNNRWTRKIGADYNVFHPRDIEADAAGNLYVVGSTTLSLGRPNPSSSEFDAFVRKYDANGDVRWTYQFGTDGGDFAHDIALGGQGNIFLVGETDGSLAVPNPNSSRDAWIALLHEQQVPEPSTAFLSLLALAAFAACRRRSPLA
jgi:hypothetical protein